MLEFCQWLQATDVFTALRGSAIVYPVILSLHMIGIAFFGAMILVTDLRLLGVAMRTYPVTSVVNRLRVPKRIGFAVMVICGVLLFSTKAEEYYYNIFFRIKMILLALVCLHALLFAENVYGSAAEMDTSGITSKAKIAAGASLVLWLGLAICGRAIGYIEPPLEKIHAFLHTAAEAPGTGAPALRNIHD
ncbi:MAG: DUF6644 family protein [Bryobacteraceae bacterium]